MTITRLDYRKILRVVLSILAGLFVIASLQRAARAESSHLIVIPANDGYGVQDCLTHSKSCGQIVASAWCEAKGYAAPLAFGRAEDVTGAIAGTEEAKLDPDAFIVKCAE